MGKITTAKHEMRLLAQFEQTCGEMPPADLLDPDTFKLFVKQMSHRQSGRKKTGKWPQ